jgi:pimeloyl-ACP methyl ester carboxylesterase
MGPGEIDSLKEADSAATRLITRLDELLAQPANPALFRRHLHSVRSLVLSERGRFALYTLTPEFLSDAVRQLRWLLNGFHSDAAEWQSYLDGKRALMLAFLSPHDGTLQFYKLGLPKEWEPERRYPLFVELHGFIPRPQPLQFICDQLGLPDDPSNVPYTVLKTYADVDRSGYHLCPWGRGNTGYVGIGEIDVLETIADAGKAFHFDPDRNYLYGFSMGGGGTWHIATRTPDRWAAIAMIAPSLRRTTGGFDYGLERNLALTPVWIACGESDELFGDYKRIVAGLGAAGTPLTATSQPGIGHAFPWSLQRESVLWLKAQARQRPDNFQFVADTDGHRGIWGVEVERDPAASVLARFSCHIDGQNIRIESSGARRIKVDAGPSGLGLTGEIAIHWNGHTAYKGASTSVVINTPHEHGRELAP